MKKRFTTRNDLAADISEALGLELDAVTEAIGDHGHLFGRYEDLTTEQYVVLQSAVWNQLTDNAPYVWDDFEGRLTWHDDGSYTYRRFFRLSEGDHVYDTIEADNVAEALQVAIEGVSRNNYDAADPGETLFIRVRAWNVDDEEDCDSVTVTLPPLEPRCMEQAHTWTNEKVHGHGGGVLIRHTCGHCDLQRTVDTWAHDPSTGEQGLTSTSYEKN